MDGQRGNVTCDVARHVAKSERLKGIDTLRGLVMVLMALDHTRDFWGMTSFNLTDPDKTSVAWFATRWVTHFCAPVFVFLTGMSAHLYGAKGRSKRQLSDYLLTRGVWLVFLEVTVVNVSWRFDYGGFLFLAVIWVIGWSMILLGGLIWLPRGAILGFSLVTITCHNLFDGVQGQALGNWDWLWFFLHESNYKQVTEQFGLVFSYPLVPWCGVMALGYSMGPLMLSNSVRRQCGLVWSGLTVTGVFFLLRGMNTYGDPHDWAVHPKGFSYSVISFLNVSKYPPSLLYLCMTLGPSLLLLSWMETWRGWGGRFLRVFGRVPLFFYLIHIPIIRLSGTIKNNYLYGTNIDPFGSNEWPSSYQPQLWMIYTAFGILLALFYPLCRWFGSIKQHRRDGWVSWL